MNLQPYAHLIRYKQWADRGLYDVLARQFERLDKTDAGNVVRVLDHIQVVDRIFQYHLQGRQHSFHAPRSLEMPDLQKLMATQRKVDDWYVTFVEELAAADVERRVQFVFTDGTPAAMTHGEIILHVCLHGTYHRGNAGVLLLKNGIDPNDDRVTDFLQRVA